MAAPTAEAIAEPQPVSTHKWAIAMAVMLGAFLQRVDTSIVNVALPYMQESFATGVEQISWVVTSYLVALSIMIPLSGWASARFGRRRFLIGSILLFVAASAMCGLARGIGQMVVFRLIQGFAGASLGPMSQAILFETFPPEEHTVAMTTFGMGMMVAPVLGPTLGGWITMHWSWRWNFYINVPPGLMAALMFYLYVHDPPYLRKRLGSGRIDYLGIIYIAVAVGLLQIVLGRGGRAGWFDAAWVRYFTAATVVSAVLLVIHELRFADPVIDLRIFKVFGYTLAVVLLSFQSAGLFSITLLNPMFLETVLGYDALRAGTSVAPRGVGVIVALLIVGRLSRRGIDTRPLVCAGFIVGAYEVWRMSQWNFSVSEGAVMWTICLFGLGLGAVFPTLSAVSIGQLPRERMGNAASLFSMLTNIGAATGIAAVTNFLTSRQRLYQGRFMESFSTLDAWKKMYALPGTDGAALPNHFLNGAITNQAWLYAYRDVYWAIAVLTLLLAPWCMLLNRPTSGRAQTRIG